MSRSGWFSGCVLLLMLTISATAAARGNRLVVGLEQFDWQEYDGEGGRLVRETGPRLMVGVEHTPGSNGRGSYFSYLARGYFGNVDYDGHLQYTDGLLTPYSTDTHYWGAALDLRYNLQFSLPGLDLVPSLSLGIGGEWWLRDLRGAYGYQEYYAVGYSIADIGLRGARPTGWFGRLGLKSPFHVGERVSGFYLDGTCNDVELEPGENSTILATLGYRLSPRSDISLGYEAYRFSSSPRKLARCSGSTPLVEIYQPRSEMALFSLRYSVSL